MTDRELMQQALEALNHLQPSHLTSFYTIGDREKAITALRERLAREEQEPVAAQHRFRHPQKGTPDWGAWTPCSVKDRPSWEIDSQGYEVEYRALYTAPAPREWVGLTASEIYAQWEQVGVPTIGWDEFAKVARAIEAKLKEKNT